MKMYSEYRAAARETLKGHWNSLALVTLFVIFIGSIFAVPTTIIGSVWDLLWLRICGTSGNYVFSLLVTVPLAYALMNVVLRMVRNEEIEGSYFQAMFRDFAANWSKYVLSGLLIGLIVALIALPTLLIGAIILNYAYRLVPYVIHDNPELGVKDTLRTSRMMMKGHKWQLFVLDLTFIGWALLCILSAGIGFLWLDPYMRASYAHFYEDVKADYSKK